MAQREIAEDLEGLRIRFQGQPRIEVLAFAEGQAGEK